MRVKIQYYSSTVTPEGPEIKILLLNRLTETLHWGRIITVSLIRDAAWRPSFPRVHSIPGKKLTLLTKYEKTR